MNFIMNGIQLNGNSIDDNCYSNDEMNSSSTGKTPFRLNGGSTDYSLDDKFNTDDMIESEKTSLLGRVHDLEKRVNVQQDEIVCLRSTLAEALRRITALETNLERNGSGSQMNVNQSGRSAPTTPSRNNSASSFSRLISNNTTNSTSTNGSPGSNGDWKYRKQTRAGSTPADYPVQLRRQASSNSNASAFSNSLRNKVTHQSNGSLHSDSHSSNSISPAPSPSPRPNSMAPTLGKRWSSTGDFAMQASLQGSTQMSTYNDEDGYLKFYLRGRPINLYAPSELRDNYELTKVQPVPSKKLKLDWVYGYRGKDCRSNLYQLPTGEMVYFVAAVVVLYNTEEQCQRHYLGHTDDVKSLAIHPNKILVATGQCSGHDRKEALAHIRVWDTISLATKAVIGMGDFHGAITSLSFSRADGGALLTAIEDAPDKIISVWEWNRGEKGHRITETRCSVDTVVAVEFHPLDRNQIVTVGKGHIAFWQLDQGGTLYKRMGIFEGRDKPKYVTCIAFTQSGEVISGDSNGNISIWGRGMNTIHRLFKKVHDGSIFTLCILRDGSLISGGGKDGRLVMFDSELNPTGLAIAIEPHFGAIRVVAEGKGSQLLIGTTRNCILTGSFELNFNPVVMGHTEELWGLSSHPNLAQFVTGGRDRLLQLWDSLSHSVVWSKDIGEQIQSCAFSSDGEAIAVGCITGKWAIFHTTSRDLLVQYQDGDEPIQDIKFSPDGKLLALGSRDNSIYIYQVSENIRRCAKIGRLQGHSSFIVHMDWSKDSKYLRSNSGDHELLFWQPEVCRQVTSASQMRDIEWDTHSCALAFTSLGVWPENADGTDVNTLAKSGDNSLLASGDDWGKVKLFSYPAIQPKTLSHNYGGHSSHVTSVTFLHDDTRLISVGGADTSVLQWTVASNY